MSLLNPIFLLGLAALSVPIVLHLIQRQRYPERPFTTLRFFDKTIKHNVIKRRFVDKLLLLLRLLLLAVLMLALARPFTGLGLGEKRMSMVIVLDNSPSMGRGSNGSTLFGRARDAAEAFTRQLAPQDSLALVLSKPAFAPAFTADRLDLEQQLRLRAGQPTGLLVKNGNGSLPALPNLATDVDVIRKAVGTLPPATPVALCGYGIDPLPQLTCDHAAVRSVLQRADLAGSPGNILGAVHTAQGLLAGSKDGDRMIVVLSDLQAADWQGDGAIDLAGVSVQVFEVPAPPEKKVNLAIEDCRVPKRKVQFGQSVLCTALVRNHGSVASGPSTKLSISLSSDKRTATVPVPQIAPGGGELVPFPIHAIGRGQVVYGTVSVDAPGDSFAYDNTWHFEIPLRPPVRVLCVNEAEGQLDGEASGSFVVNALAPRTPSAQAAPFADVDECSAAGLNGKELFPYNVVILAGVEKLEKKSRDALRSFAEDGGGLLIFPNAQAVPEEYNGWGFLPARVQAARQKDFVYVKSIAERAPAMAAMAVIGDAAVQGLSSSSWLDVAAESDAAVLARFSNDMPCLVDRPLGKGRVILAATGCHTDASDWPLRPAFVPLLRGLTSYLSDSRQMPVMSAEREVDEGMATTIPPEMLAGTPGAFRMELTGVGADYHPMPWLRRGTTLLLPRADRPGHYVLSLQPAGGKGTLMQPGLGAATVAVAVNHDVAESVFTPIPSDKIKELLRAPAVKTAVLGENEELDVTALKAVQSARSGRDLWRLAALLALVVIVAESLIAWRLPTNASS